MQLWNNTQVWRLLNTHLPHVAIPGREATPPGTHPPMAWLVGGAEETPLLATGCTGNEVRGREGGMFPDVLSPFIIFLIPQTPSRAAAAALHPAPRRAEG